MKLVSCSTAFLAAGLLAAPAIGQHVVGQFLIDPQLPGQTAFDDWGPDQAGSGVAPYFSSDNHPGYGDFPGTAPWPNPILPRESSSTGGEQAALKRIAGGGGGGPFISSSSVYFGGFSGNPNTFGGTLAVVDESPVTNLANVVLQIEIGSAVGGYDLYDADDSGDGDPPVLSFNSDTQRLQATYTRILGQVEERDSVPPEGEEEPAYITTYFFQWDLTGITDPIGSFTIDFSAVQHSQVYSMRLDQSDTYSPIPEPSLLSMAAGGLMLLARRRQRI